MIKTILITGASSGIGKETAKYFSHKLWNVAATMRSPEKEEELGSLLNVKLYRLDVTSEEDIREAVKKVVEDFGKVDVLLNNAGYGAIGAFEKSTDEEIKKQFEVNVFGLMSLSREMIPYFRKQGYGTIINVSSVAGRITFPLYSIYHASKFAVEGFSESLQYELQNFNIQVKLIEPGSINTEFHGRSQNTFEKEGLQGYEKLEKSIFTYMKKSSENAPGPIVVAETIYKAATDGKKKLRYPAGKQAKMVLLSHGLLPNSWFNSIVGRVAGLLKKRS